MKKPSNHDEYIARAAAFAVPILTKIRKVVHKACPDVEETMKWSTPHFDHDGPIAGMAAFKAHVSFGLWRGRELSDPDGLLEIVGKTGIGSMRLEKPSDLPSERVLLRYLKEAVRLNEAARAAPRKKSTTRRAPKKELPVPPALAAALAKHRRARATFDGFSWSHRKEYIEWIAEAKRDATRTKRVQTAIEYLSEGKPRNWKYMKEWS